MALHDESSWARIEPRAITLVGDRVSYRLAGTGPLLLLVHGMTGSAETWRHVMPPLAERFTVLAPDLLGHGQSDKPRAECSLGAHTDTLRDLMDALGPRQGTFVGQSLGGGIAMQLAYQSPERCERLVLVSGGGLGREVSVILRASTFPAAEYLFPLVCSPPLRDAGDVLAAWSHGSAFTRRQPSKKSGGATPRWPTRRPAGRSSAGCAMSSHAGGAHEAIPGSRLEIFGDEVDQHRDEALGRLAVPPRSAVGREEVPRRP